MRKSRPALFLAGIFENAAQSTNDAYPSVLHIALALGNRKLIRELKTALADSFRGKAKRRDHIVKMGRTQLQHVVPMTLGREFEAFAPAPIREAGLGNDYIRHRETRARFQDAERFTQHGVLMPGKV
jgi:hypothetical protein